MIDRIGSSPLPDRVEAQIQVSPYPRREHFLWHCWPNWTRSYRIIQCPCMYPLCLIPSMPLVSPPCYLGYPNRYAPWIISQRPQFLGRLLCRVTPRRRTPTHQWHLLCLLSSPPSLPGRFHIRRNQYFAQQPFDSQHVTREHTASLGTVSLANIPTILR